MHWLLSVLSLCLVYRCRAFSFVSGILFKQSTIRVIFNFIVTFCCNWICEKQESNSSVWLFPMYYLLSLCVVENGIFVMRTLVYLSPFFTIPFTNYLQNFCLQYFSYQMYITYISKNLYQSPARSIRILEENFYVCPLQISGKNKTFDDYHF